MQARLLLGPSGTGKTFRCLAEVRAALQETALGAPLVFLAPRQATFQLERQLLGDGGLVGYSRLRILSFEALAELILSQFSDHPPQVLNEEGRLMVLRALLSRQRNDLELFRASARLRGFAQQLSVILRELQTAGAGPEEVRALANRLDEANPLRMKMRDAAAMLEAYLRWLKEHQLQDTGQLLSLATALLTGTGQTQDHAPGSASHKPAQAAPTIAFGGLWLDGFAELSVCELEFLKSVLPSCARATLAFNVDAQAIGAESWMSGWTLVGRTIRRLEEALRQTPGVELSVQDLPRDSAHNRFGQCAVLSHLEKRWWTSGAEPQERAQAKPLLATGQSLRVVLCDNPEAEAREAARALRQFVRQGARYRDAAVIVRDLERYYDPIRRAFTAYEIPFFLDRREPVGHHPLLELTRNAVRTVALEWQNEDWFGALKTGLVHRNQAQLDRLENEALARGWKGEAWLKPLSIPDNAPLQEWLEPLRQKLVVPFQRLASSLGAKPSGTCLAQALARFWDDLGVGRLLQEWSTASLAPSLTSVSPRVHATVWEQMQDWLDNIALAFADEPLGLREWLPILEAGLGSQSVGVIPPTLDQVLVGAVDRSRNPNLKLAIVLGMNEAVFPAPASEAGLLTMSDRQQLGELGLELGATNRHRLAQEQYLGYIACTRAQQQLVLTCAARDEDDQALNPSPFLDRLQVIFPGLKIEPASFGGSWQQAEHTSELVEPMLRPHQSEALAALFPKALLELPSLANLRQRWLRFRNVSDQQQLVPELAEALYGTTLETSVSRLEEYAACPFRFFVTCGLHAEERTRFQVDVRQQGSFQHEVLARFHHQLEADGKRWRDLSAAQGRALIGRIAAELIPQYENGLLLADEQSEFTARALTTSLQDFIATLLDWLPQYQFDPHAVELAFGIEEKPLPAWEMELGGGHRLSFRGKIDRVDIRRAGSSEQGAGSREQGAAGAEAWCVVIDYKSSARKLDPVLMAHGVQLQLPAYLNVLRALANPQSVFGVERLIPAGVFFVNLRGRYEAAKTRQEAVASVKEARSRAYQHTGRFDTAALRYLDARADAQCGDQFNYRLKKNGELHAKCQEALTAAEFKKMLDAVEGHLKTMGQQIYAGNVRPDPYRKGNTTACDRCEYGSICRIDPWTHLFRVLS